MGTLDQVSSAGAKKTKLGTVVKETPSSSSDKERLLRDELLFIYN